VTMATLPAREKSAMGTGASGNGVWVGGFYPGLALCAGVSG